MKPFVGGCFLFLTCLASPLLANEPTREPPLLICGVWPDRILFFDQTKDEFIDGLQLRHGAVVGMGYTPDKRRWFLVTDRMESVEVVDPVRREVVDEFKLSTEDRRIRILNVFPDSTGRHVYLAVNVVRTEKDRYILDDQVEIMRYDLEKREVTDSFKFPDEIGARGRLVVSPDGQSLYVIGRDIYVLDAKDHTIKDRIILSKPLLAGYGPLRGLSLTDTEPGVFYGIYHTTDPVQKKNLFGVTKLDLFNKKVETFELGPDLRLGLFALSSDGTRGYAGLNDMVVVDMEKKKVVLRKEKFERGRSNTSIIVSFDKKKLYISGVGDTMYIYDAETLKRIKEVRAGGDFMMRPVELPSP